MTENWNDIKWIFEPDHGTCRDIYVQESTIQDWEKVIDLINTEFSVCYDLSDGQRVKRPIDKNYSRAYLTDKTQEIEPKSAAVDLGNIEVRTHFFIEDEIEFDLDPEDVNSTEDVEKVLHFMKSVSKTLNKQVILTQENNPNFPNIKVDVNRNIQIILTEQDIKQHIKKSSIRDKLFLIRTKFLIKYFPKYFTKKLVKSSQKPHKASKSDESRW